MDIQKVKEAFSTIRVGIRMLDGGPMDYYLDKLAGCYELLISRFAPFKIGEKVFLRRTPSISESKSWGWLGGKHFLVKGAIAEVRDIDAESDGFYFFIAFDDDSWIESHTKKVHPRPPKNRGIYRFYERELASAPTSHAEDK